jgi:hypothetical protein
MQVQGMGLTRSQLASWKYLHQVDPWMLKAPATCFRACQTTYAAEILTDKPELAHTGSATSNAHVVFKLLRAALLNVLIL